MWSSFKIGGIIRNSVTNILPKRHSALFVNGIKATETYIFITPEVDHPKNINKEQMCLELIRRNSPYDLNKLQNVWNMYDELKQRKANFESKKSEMSKQLSKLIKEDQDNDEVRRLKIQIDLLKENIKILKNPLWSVELEAMTQALSLPNNLHPLTGDMENVIYSHLSCPTKHKNHLEIGEILDIINFKKNENYYLCGDAAVFELGAKFYFSNKLKQHDYIQFSNADFVKSVIIEGCGGNHTDPNSTFILHHNENTEVNTDNRLHLTGAGSLSSFFAYHAKNVIYSKYLPLKYFTLGRQYLPSPSDEDSLLHVSQSSVVQTFEVFRDETEQQIGLNSVTDTVKEIYSALGFHFRLNIEPAHKLLMWESLRINIEMYSTSLNEYVAVGNISVSGDFLSKRLLFTYIDKKESKFPYIISGTILNVPKLLGCILEHEQDFKLPEVFQVENWNK